MTDKAAMTIAALVGLLPLAVYVAVQICRHYRRPRMATISKRDANLQRFNAEWREPWRN